MGWIVTNHSGSASFQCRELNNSQVFQGVSLRNCGNMALHTGDEPIRVVGRRRSWLQTLGLDLNHLVSGVQVHGTRIALVEQTDMGLGAFTIDNALPDTDALITKDGGVILATYTADCLPIFVYDPVTPSVAVIHAGWRGAIDGIATLTIQRMIKEFGVNPVNCLVAIGPSICGGCFRVERQLAERFAEFHPQAVVIDESENRVDLQTFIKLEMISNGVLADQIYEAGLCTSCHRDLFFSYRAEQGVSGRMMGIIGLKHRNN